MEVDAIYFEGPAREMKRTDVSHFSHVLAAVQRTGSLAGGSVRRLPNGNFIDGLQGIHSVALEIAEAQKELQLARVRSALERIKQLEKLKAA